MHRWIATHRLDRLAVGVLLLASTACKELNPDFDGPASAGSSSSDGTGTVPTTTMPMPMTTTGVDGTSSTSAEPGTTTGAVSPESSSGDGNTTTTGASTGGEEPLYPPCMLDGDPVCPRPYVECYDFLAPDYTVCTIPCQQDDECPTPPTGDAVPVCAGQSFDQCLLDCAGGATCPDGMECQQVGPGGMFERCLWPS